MQRNYEELMEKSRTVYDWLVNKPQNTKKMYGGALWFFCESMKVTPEQFQDMEPKEARDTVWQYIRSFSHTKPSSARNALAALKSFYRNKDAVVLSFDSRRGGKHYFNGNKRKKVAFEHVPSKEEMYQIIDMATSLRDKAILLILFQSGIRNNALCNLNYGMVREQLEENKVPLKLRITGKIDTKLQGYSIDFYDTFLGYEAVEALKAYCKKAHKDSIDDTPLFYTRNKKRMLRQNIWVLVKRAVKRAGFDRKTMWVHTIRRAFKKQVRKALVDDDFKEAIMGHVLPGSRENYFSRLDVKEIENAYMKIDFSREIPTSETQRLKEQLEKEQIGRAGLEKRIESLENLLHQYVNGKG